MQFKFFLLFGTALAFYCFNVAFSQQHHAENSPPKVTILAPAKNSGFQWNSIIPYSINISDKEDGNSEYNEISTNEVLLKVLYLPDSSGTKKYLSEMSRISTESRGLLLMTSSTCFMCHAAKNKLIGPSFNLIAKRYPNSAFSLEMLAKKVINGSTGVWGDVSMPPHPDLKIDQAKEIVRWILENNSNPNLYYFTGIEGAFRTKEKPDKEYHKGVYILTASYTDHGLKDIHKLRKRGQYTMVLKHS